MSDEEILDLADAWSFIDYGRLSFNNLALLEFARAIESRALTNQKAKWYQEGVEAALRQALAEPPNSTTDVVESENQEPLTLGEEQKAQQQLETHLEAVYQRNNQAFLAQARLGQFEERVAISDKQRHDWVEITRGEIVQALLDSSNDVQLGFAIEAICKKNNGYT